MTSMTPTTCMNVVELTGMTFVARGLRYILQSVNLLKYLSTPAMIGPSPTAIFSAHQLALRRLSKSFITGPHLSEVLGKLSVTNLLPDAAPNCANWIG